MALLTAIDLTAAVAAPAGDADLVARVAAAADQAVRRHLGRDFTAGPFTEYHPAGARLLFLSQYPVATVSSVAVDVTRAFPIESIRPVSSYLVHPNRGVIESPDGPFMPTLPGWTVRSDDYPNAVRVIYTAIDSVPDSVKQATLLLGEHWYREAKTHAATAQLNVGTLADGTVYPWGQSSGYQLPPAVMQLLNLERVPML